MTATLSTPRARAHALAEPSEVAALARRLDQHGNDWRIQADHFTDRTVGPDVPCLACQVEGAIGQVHVAYSPPGCPRILQDDVCAACAPDWLTEVSRECGCPDVHRELIDVEVRRADA